VSARIIGTGMLCGKAGFARRIYSFQTRNTKKSTEALNKTNDQTRCNRTPTNDTKVQRLCGQLHFFRV